MTGRKPRDIFGLFGQLGFSVLQNTRRILRSGLRGR